MITTDINRMRRALAGPTFVGVQTGAGMALLLVNVRGSTRALWWHDNEAPIVIRRAS